MRKLVLAVVSAVMVVSVTVYTAHGAFETFNIGVKPMGLVDTFSCLGDEPVGMMYNPAQVVQMKRSAISTSFSKPDMGWGDADIGIYSIFYSNPFKDSKMSMGFGASYMQTNLNYGETLGFLNLSIYYDKVFGTPVTFAWGLNGKLLSMKRGDPLKSWDPALKEMTITKNTADVGIWLEYNGYAFGYSELNIIEADFGVVAPSVIPKERRIGLGAKNIPFLNRYKISPAIEYTNRNQYDLVSAGATVYMLKMLDFSFGYSKNNLGFGMTVFLNARPEEQDEYTRDGCMRIDVSWLYPISGIDSAGSPQIGLFYYFK